jgi:hypothetical protein
MNPNKKYRTITREQFLFHEMRITANLLLKGLSDDEIVNKIYNENLYQYPTMKMVKNIAKVCLARLHTLDGEKLVDMIANGPSDTAKQVCLYAMIKQYRLVSDFMIGVIGEKYRSKDMSYSRMDINAFFTRLQEQNSEVAKWSDSSIQKMKQVLTKILVLNQYLDSTKSTTLNPVLIDLDLKEILKERNEKAILTAFNCFD